MINVLPAYSSMTRDLDIQPAQRQLWPDMTEADVARSIAAGYAFAAYRGTKILAIGGIARFDADRGLVWGVLSGSIGRDFVGMHAAVKQALAAAPFMRIEAQIENSFAPGHRWIKALGFEQEGLMRKYWRGRDFMLYAKVR